MPDPLTEASSLHRDGTSQSARAGTMLDPAGVAIDGRSLRDQLVFAHALAAKLVYYDETNRAAGTWEGLFSGIGGTSDGTTLSYDQVAAFLDRPEDFDPKQYPALRRPHFLLFLAFLRLLETGRDALNGVTRRHLDFYYRQVLRMAPRPAVPDRAFILFDLARNTASAEVPEGTRLSAGRDGDGKDRIYRTERNLVVNRSKIERLMSVFADRQVIGMAEARTADTGTQEDRFLDMLTLPLGDPAPGDALPLYRAVPFSSGKKVDFPLLGKLADLVAFSTASLWLELSELRTMVTLKRRRDGADGDWRTINGILEKAGRVKRGKPSWSFKPADPRNFDANLAAALEGKPDFSGLPEIETVDDLYTQRQRQDAKAAIQSKLYMSEEDFVLMMDPKRLSDSDWSVVNGLLEQGGRGKRHDDNWVFAPAVPDAFQSNFDTALGKVDFASVGVTKLDGYYDALVGLEQYFFMSAEEFAQIMACAERAESTVSAREWDAVYAILDGAHKQKFYASRRAGLRTVREAEADAAEGYRSVLAIAAGEGEAAGTEVLLNRVADFVTATELTTLEAVARQLEGGGGDAGVDWSEVYDILERAQRKRERTPDPVPCKEMLLNHFAFADARSAEVPVPPGTVGAETRWKTFGRSDPQPDRAVPPPEIMGWSIASPLFTLSGGLRRITLRLGFLPDPALPLQYPDAFSVWVSTAKGWIRPQVVLRGLPDYSALPGIAPLEPGTKLHGIELTLTVALTDPAIAPPPASEAYAGCPWPVVRVMLAQSWDPKLSRFVTRYQTLRPLRLARVQMEAAVGSFAGTSDQGGQTGLSPTGIESDAGVLDGRKPFEPFGPSPATGSRIVFSHPDLFDKRLKSLRCNLTWMGGPKDLAANYKAYGIDTTKLAVTAALVDCGIRRTGLGSLKLFDGNDATRPRTQEVSSIADSLHPYAVNEPAPPRAVNTWWRTLEWELAPLDFQHSVYPSLATQKSLEMAAAMANKGSTPIVASDYQVLPPYTPKLKSITLDFVAGHEVLLDSYQPGPTTDQIYHVHPFGAVEAGPTAAGEGFPLLPDYDNEGELYIGISGASPPQTLSLLFRMAEGSGDPDVQARPVAWSQLCGDGWNDLGGERILQDTTRGLINSGIVEYSLPKADPDPRLPPGLYWLRAAMAAGTAGVCDTAGIHPGAVAACLAEDGTALEDPLPAGSIKRMVETLPGIAGITQPYASFGAKPAEADDGFRTRVAERLRHKLRAVSIWDYERLVLDRFPQLYKVKCMPASAVEGTRGPGLVRIVVIPDVRNQNSCDPVEPKAAADLLADVGEYLAPLVPSTARVEVANPTYIQVRVRVGVRFRSPDNEEFDKQRLNDDLIRFLSPWAYDEGVDIVIGRRIYANSIVAFIDQIPYVDYVAGIKLFSSADGETFTMAPSGGEEGDYVDCQRPDAVLVTARQHEIDVIVDDVYEAQEFEGINYMKVELDFVVA